MFATKKFAPLLALLALSCGKQDSDNSASSSVTFFNNSSYSVSIYEDSFSGPLLIDKLAPGMSYSTTLSPSYNYGSGSVFSVEYWYLVANHFECSCGDVWAGSIDINAQIFHNMEVDKEYVIQIPQPEELKLKAAFLKISNTSDKHFELNHLGTHFRQAGNGELPVPSGKVGVYKIVEEEIKDYTIAQVSERYPFPEVIAKNGYIYNFEFDGNSVKIKEEQEMIFR